MVHRVKCFLNIKKDTTVYKAFVYINKPVIGCIQMGCHSRVQGAKARLVLR